MLFLTALGLFLLAQCIAHGTPAPHRSSVVRCTPAASAVSDFEVRIPGRPPVSIHRVASVFLEESFTSPYEDSDDDFLPNDDEEDEDGQEEEFACVSPQQWRRIIASCWFAKGISALNVPFLVKLAQGSSTAECDSRPDSESGETLLRTSRRLI
ncbi:MAG: hypothetical protein U0903_07155 [Planctomycetales bacterium]